MKNPKAAYGGFAIGAILLIVFLCIQGSRGNPLDLPLPFLLLPLVPIVSGFVLGGYIKKFKTPIIEAELENLPEAPQHEATKTEPPPTEWQHKRSEEYARTNGYMLAHVYRPSTEPQQVFDIFIFVVRHQKGTSTPPKRTFTEIQKAEFFFGESWGNEVFTAPNTGGVIGVRTHAWGTFLATCRITFKDPNKPPIILHRYVDFSMAPEENRNT